MDDLATILILIGLGIFILAAVAFFKPMPKLRLGTRKAAGVAMALSVGSCITGGAIMPPTDQVGSPPRQKAIAPASSSSPRKVAGLDAAEVAVLWERVTTSLEPCEVAGKRVAELSTGMSEGRAAPDMVELYGKIVEARDSCRNASNDLGDLRAPKSAKGEIKKAFSDALEKCQLSAVSRQMAYDGMAKVADGDARPSQVHEARETMERAELGAMLCVAELMTAAEKGGVPMETFDTKKG